MAFQPISSEDLWWQLSRGRQVLLGSLQPSADLLALETGREADWLGGTAGYLLYLTFGASGLMLARLGLVGLGALLILNRPAAIRTAADPSGSSPSREAQGPGWLGATLRLWPILVGGTALLAISPSLDPLPAAFDLMGVVFLWCWLHAGRLRSWRARPAWLVLLFLVWSNLSSGVALGAGILAAWAIVSSVRGSTTRRLAGWRDLLLALLAGSLNPRGIWGWVDSVQMLLPVTVASPAVLERTPWTPLPTAEWEFAEYCLLGFTLLWLVRLGRAARRSTATPSWAVGWENLPFAVASFLLVQAAAWLSAANVPLAVAWLACELIGRREGPADAEALRAGSTEGALQQAEQDGLARPRWLAGRGWGRAAMVLGLLLILMLSGRLSAIGWGIEARLDYRLLELALSGVKPHGTAFADNARSGGMLAWVLQQRPALSDREFGAPLQLQDMPGRALLGGRLQEHQQLLVDLRQGRETRYWREDRSPGGWWLPLLARNTSVLCVSSSDLDLIRALEPTIWKSLSLDSPVLPYARAGDPAYIDRVLEVLRYRQLVNLEPWAYQPASSSGSAFDRDFLGWRHDGDSAAATLRQARVFRAMQLHYAALRVLFVGRRHWPSDPHWGAEVRRCQAELAARERRVSGQASWLRDWAAQTSDPDQIEPREPPWLGRPQRQNLSAEAALEQPAMSAEAAGARGELLRQIQVYLHAGPEAAMATADNPQHPQAAYAWLCWALESGQHELARRLGSQLSERALMPNLRLLVQYRMEELGPQAELPKP